MRMLLNYPFPQGILLVKELIDAYGLEVVQAYMGHIQVQGLGGRCVHLRIHTL